VREANRQERNCGSDQEELGVDIESPWRRRGGGEKNNMRRQGGGVGDWGFFGMAQAWFRAGVCSTGKTWEPSFHHDTSLLSCLRGHEDAMRRGKQDRRIQHPKFGCKGKIWRDEKTSKKSKT